MRTEVLDHGYLELVETWGSDERIIEAARMSTNKGFQGWGPIHAADCEFHKGPSPTLGLVGCSCDPKAGDEKLLRYLYTHKHATPFEMAGLVIEVQAPIFVFREWHRHRTQSYNELSARYTPLPDVNYTPSRKRVIEGAASTGNKQASGTTPLIEGAVDPWLANLDEFYRKAEALYQDGLAAGIPKELARLCIPVGRYSRMRASANLRNWLAFLTLRMDQNAQWEIRQYANAVGQLIADRFPRTWTLFNEARPK